MIEFLKLLSIVLAPLLLVFPIVIYLYKTRHKDRIKWSFGKYCRTFDANHGLGSQPWFSISITYPIGLFLSTGIWAWSGYNLDISSDGFITFIEISKLPLGLLGLSIPLGVLSARLHGTKQTALQINVTEQKNKTDLYLSHYNHFNGYIDNLIEILEINDDNKNSTPFLKHTLYKVLYPDSSIDNGTGDISEGLYIRACDHMRSICEIILRIKTKHMNSNEFHDLISTLTNRTSNLLKSVGVNKEHLFLSNMCETYQGPANLTYFTDYQTLSSVPDILLKIIKYIYSFDKLQPDFSLIEPDTLSNRNLMYNNLNVPNRINELFKKMNLIPFDQKEEFNRIYIKNDKMEVETILNRSQPPHNLNLISSILIKIPNVKP